MMKIWKAVVVVLVSTALVASSSAAQTGASGVIAPRKKTCTLEVPQGQPGAGCVATVTAKDTGTTCENGKKKITIDVTITCGNEVCDDYPTQTSCGNDGGSFRFACNSNTITVDTQCTWPELLGPNGDCDHLSAKGSH